MANARSAVNFPPRNNVNEHAPFSTMAPRWITLVIPPLCFSVVVVVVDDDDVGGGGGDDEDAVSSLLLLLSAKIPHLSLVNFSPHPSLVSMDSISFMIWDCFVWRNLEKDSKTSSSIGDEEEEEEDDCSFDCWEEDRRWRGLLRIPNGGENALVTLCGGASSVNTASRRSGVGGCRILKLGS